MRITKYPFESVVLSPSLSFALTDRVRASTLIPLEMWDCPGTITVDTLGTSLSEFSSIVFVIDIRVSALPSQTNSTLSFAQDLYQQPIVKLVEFIVAACHVNPLINLEVFVHKAEKLQEDDKIGRILRSSRHDLLADIESENFRQIHERVMDRLADESPEYEQVSLNFHLTSVYDYSLQEAFSRVIHKLIDSLPYLENLLNVFCAVSPRRTCTNVG